MKVTECLSSRYKGLDQWSASEILAAIYDGQLNAIAAVRPAIADIAKAGEAIARKLAQNPASRLIYVGAGSSGLLAMQDAMEMPPTFNWPLERLVFMMAGGEQSRLVPNGIFEDDARAAQRDAAHYNVSENDVVIAVSASGTTPYSVCVTEIAQNLGALTVALANNPDTALLRLATYGIYLESGPEIPAGSTRMAAGTAQKAALGMLSTLVMTRLGHLHDGLMVSLIADNTKLRQRAIDIVSDIVSCDAETAQNALQQADGHVKLAILVASDFTLSDAHAALEAADGNLREVFRKFL